MKTVKSLVSRFWKDEEGAALVEYGLLVALIAVACIVAITATGTSISGLFDGVSGEITGATP